MLALAAVWNCWQQLERMKWSREYSLRSARDTYRRVMAQPAPLGLTGLRVAGRAYFGMKHWVWMTFDLRPAAMKQIIAEREPLTPDDVAQRYRGRRSVNSHFDARDQQVVGWREIHDIEQPVVYDIGSSADGSPFIWFGTLTLDRKRRRGFIQAWGD